MKLLIAVLLIASLNTSAQSTGETNAYPNIRTIMLFRFNNQESLPVINLNSADKLELHFDDLDGYAKNYYYTYVLCNADWTPADMSSFDYIGGFQNQQLTEYRVSSFATTNYIHYQAVLPDKDCRPTQSGNYLLKVYLDADPEKVVFTKRFYVVNKQVGISGTVSQPFDNQIINTHQKIQFTVNAAALNMFNPEQQIKVTILQNYRMDNAITNIQPVFNRDNVLEYSSEEDALFPAGKEYRWIDLRSFRFQSEKLDKIDLNSKPIDLYLRPDGVRVQQRFQARRDLNGWYEITTTESINPWWQADYANVHFTLVPDNRQPFEGKDVYISGALTGNDLTDDARMQFNSDKGVYEKTLLLKQGYYYYTYITKDKENNDARPDATLTDGNSWETENDYSIFIYYRALSDRHDQLIALTTINSRTVKP